MNRLLSRFVHLFDHHPIIRGMLSYGISWPACSLMQEYLEYGKTLENADWGRAARFCIFGGLFMSPVYYYWLKCTFPYFQKPTFFTAVKRAAIEQVSFGPFGLSYFLFVMSLLERQPLEICVKEVKDKFWPTYKAGCMYWPLAQTVNYYWCTEKNRLIYVSCVSFVWTVYLGHVKSKKRQHKCKINLIYDDGITVFFLLILVSYKQLPSKGAIRTRLKGARGRCDYDGAVFEQPRTMHGIAPLSSCLPFMRDNRLHLSSFSQLQF